MPATSIAADPLKIVNIILPKANTNTGNNDIENTLGASLEECDTRACNNSSATNSSSSSSNLGGYVPPRNEKSDEVLFAEPTFSEKFFRYLVIVIYLGGLSSLGFFLSIYYIFFWDSRMPPVFKPTKKPPIFIKS